MRPEFDDRDSEIRDARIAALDAVEGPRVGDFVIFACGTVRRISYIWDWPEESPTVQTAAVGGSGRWYLGDGYVSFSGSLYRGVKQSTLIPTDEMRDGCVWFFHRDWMMAHNGVETKIPFRVYRCSEEAPQ